jgi:3-phenylpropionate/trans-cinnamate dioxygenase ferredoxin reductase component
MSETSIVIVGAGIAGISIAEALRDLGHQGGITLVSDEAALPYDRPPLSKDALIGGTRPALLRDESWFAEQRLDLILGDGAVGVADQALLLASGAAIPFDRLVLATGTRARRLGLCDTLGDGVHYLRTDADAERLRPALRPGARIAVIGGGVIGLEVAASACALGATATVIEAGARLMGRSLSPAGSAALADHHRACAVDLRLGMAIAGLRRDEDGTIVITLADGEDIRADAVVVGIGAEPNVDLALAAGLAIEDGILVDAQGRTSRPDIFAIGDVARFPSSFHGAAIRIEQWQHAIDHARAVAAAMLGGEAPYADMPWFWSDQGSLALQVVGRTDGDVEIERPEGAGRVIFHLDGGKLVGATSFNLPRLRRPLAKLIGATIDPAILADSATDIKALAKG